MVWTIFFLVIALFALRGLFVGFTGIIARLSGLLLGYLSILYYQPVAAEFIASLLAPTASSTVIGLLSTSGLFITVYFTISTLIQLAANGLGIVIPWLKPLLSKRSVSSAIAGLTVNAGVGGLLFLVGLWAYGMLVESPKENNALYMAADYVGGHIMKTEDISTVATLNRLLDNSALSSEKTSTPAITQPSASTQTSIGTATIISEENPGKRLSLLQRYSPEQLTEIISDPTINEKLLNDISNNPDAIKKVEALINSNPELIKTLMQYNEEQK